MRAFGRLGILVGRFVFVVWLGALVHARAQAGLSVKFGLENNRHFMEEQVTRQANVSTKAPRDGAEPLFRFFTTKSSWGQAQTGIFARHSKLWQLLEKEAGPKRLEMTQGAYAKVLGARDPYLKGLINDTAPSLYFDFTGLSRTEYVLSSIEIQTIDFAEYRGGGFFNDEAWYDILLKHERGTHAYPIDRRLRFTGSGRTVLRFWSDNWYANLGIAPQGCYTIDVTFVFTVNGQTEKVSTGQFKIDV